MIIFLLIILPSSFCQEYVTGIQKNKALKSVKLLKNGTSNDTLILPFIEDFSYPGPYPDEQKWLDKHVYINTTYPENPLSLGVVTFDAINQHGFLYPHASTSAFHADTLTSRIINLKRYKYTATFDTFKLKKTKWNDFYIKLNSNYNEFDTFFIKQNNVYIPGTDENFYQYDDTLYIKTTCDTCFEMFSDTLYHQTESGGNFNYTAFHRNKAARSNYNISDSIYLSFYVQPQGIADAPEKSDSLMVEFYFADSNQWEQVHRLAGDTSSDFQKITIPITSGKYLSEGFQFRFINKASLASSDDIPGLRSNVDQWNIDYIILDWNRRQNRNSEPDVAWVSKNSSLLRDYEAIPWNQWADAFNQLRNNDVKASLRNNDNEVRNFHVYFDILKENMQKVEYINWGSKPGGALFEANEVFEVDTALSYDFDRNSAGINSDSAIFYIKGYFNTDYATDLIHENDTFYQKQVFYNYFSYDDGSAEAGWGLAGQGTDFAEVAYRFENFKTDSLQGIYMYFNDTQDTTVQKTFFKLTVWNDNNGEPGDIIYQETGSNDFYPLDENRPVHYNLNTFKLYRLDDPILLEKGIFYVGWEQLKEKYMNIGMDMNNISKSHLFFNYDGVWRNSAIEGALMMRPALGKKIPLSIDKTQDQYNNTPFIIYPNPANQYVYIDTKNKTDIDAIQLRILNIQGQLLYQGQQYVHEPIDIHSLNEGMYILQVFREGILLNTTKLIIAR